MFCLQICVQFILWDTPLQLCVEFVEINFDNTEEYIDDSFSAHAAFLSHNEQDTFNTDYIDDTFSTRAEFFSYKPMNHDSYGGSVDGSTGGPNMGINAPCNRRTPLEMLLDFQELTRPPIPLLLWV